MMTSRKFAAGFLALTLVLSATSCGSDEPAVVTEAPASVANELFGSPTVSAGSSVETAIQGLTQDDEISIQESAPGIDAKITGSHPNRRVTVKVDNNTDPGQYTVEFVLDGPDSSQLVRWMITVP